VDAAAAKFDEEDEVETTQRNRFDGEEVTGEHVRGLLAKEGRPARRFPPRRRLEPSARKKEAERPALVLLTRRLAGGQKTLIP
jgi:hypothetical protein